MYSYKNAIHPYDTTIKGRKKYTTFMMAALTYNVSVPVAAEAPHTPPTFSATAPSNYWQSQSHSD